MKAVFDVGSGADDAPRRYHFPSRYLPTAAKAAGDWIIYREPRRGGSGGYVAVAQVARVVPDSKDPRFSYAEITGYLAFDEPVPLRHAGGFYESRLTRFSNQSKIGTALQGRSVRDIPEDEFAAIARAGLRQTLAPENAIRLERPLS
jgi:putative restriction endonuclease